MNPKLRKYLKMLQVFSGRVQLKKVTFLNVQKNLFIDNMLLPCIIFIDEIDAVEGQRGGGTMVVVMKENKDKTNWLIEWMYFGLLLLLLQTDLIF